MGDEPSTGLDRRTLIKAAAVAGGVAWTAPVIIDSLASPAAAGTGTGTGTGVLAPGQYWYLFKATYSADPAPTPTANCGVVLQSTVQCADPSGASCNNTPTLATRIQPGDPGDSLLTATFSSCVNDGVGVGQINQGICWALDPSQGTITTIDLVGACGGTGFGGCFSQPACAGTNTMFDPSSAGTVNNNFIQYPIIRISVP